MNRIAAIALVAASALTIASSASAQNNVVAVDVPFNFTVNNTFLPAGSYTFGFDLMHPDMLVIRDGANNVKATDFGQLGSIGEGTPRTLVFHQYGDQYFLSEVRLDSAADGIFLPVANSERRARKASRNEELALVAAH
jgi:hypothetical protein